MVNFQNVLGILFSLVIFLLLLSTFIIAFLDYRRIRKHYEEEKQSNIKFYEDHCINTAALAKYSRLHEVCDESARAMDNEPELLALTQVIMRWSLCSESGCDVFLDRFMRYFSLSALFIALIIGFFGARFINHILGRRFAEKLPTFKSE